MKSEKQKVVQYKQPIKMNKLAITVLVCVGEKKNIP